MRQLTLEEASLHDIISDTISSIRPQAESRSVSLVGEVSGGVDPVLINPPRLQRVLHNLLSNALRHTPRSLLTLLDRRQVGLPALHVPPTVWPGDDLSPGG